MQSDRAQLVCEIAALDRKIKTLSYTLDPVFRKEQRAREGISASHGGIGKFDPRGAMRRASLFEQLLLISIEHGGDKRTLKDLKRMMTAYVKELQRLEKARAH
jgi:hypothetical protein